jgi:hypothetical protein
MDISITDYYRSLIGNLVVSRFILEWSAPSFGSCTSDRRRRASRAGRCG